MESNKDQIVFLDFNEALDLVERISQRVSKWGHIMSDSEKEAMASLLSDCGVKVSDLIDVSLMADNYGINAEIVTPEEAEQYDSSTLRDALFTWEFEGGKYYCIQW